MPFKDPEDRKRYQREWKKQRRAGDPDWRKKTNAANRDYLSRHKLEINEERRRRYADDPAFRARCLATHSKSDRVKRLRWNYGLSAEDYNAMLLRQGGACGICERPFACTPCVDHCPLTGMVRGLLCNHCNIGLGHYEDNPAFLRKAAQYMERWLLHLLQLLSTGENMTTAGEGQAPRVMRNAILDELRRPFGVASPPPADQLQAVARALVTKAVAHDLEAIKEILERIDGRISSTPTIDLAKLASLAWKLRSSLSGKSQSPTGLASDASPATHDASAPPAL